MVTSYQVASVGFVLSRKLVFQTGWINAYSRSKNFMLITLPSSTQR